MASTNQIEELDVHGNGRAVPSWQQGTDWPCQSWTPGRVVKRPQPPVQGCETGAQQGASRLASSYREKSHSWPEKAGCPAQKWIEVGTAWLLDWTTTQDDVSTDWALPPAVKYTSCMRAHAGDLQGGLDSRASSGCLLKT